MKTDHTRITIRQALKYASEQLTVITDNHYREAQLLVAHVAGLTVTQVHTRGLDEMANDSWQRLQTLIDRRLQHEPLPYVLGQWSFYGLTLTVNRDVLIPRPETEVLVDTVLAELAADRALQVVDLGTGSGAIAIALAYYRPYWQLWAIDSQPEALKLACDNAERYRLANIHFRQGQWLRPLNDNKVDAIISNPPYVASRDPHFKERSLQFEPRSALDGGETGLQAIEQIVEQAPSCLADKGLLALEHGYDQQPQVLALMRRYFDKVRSVEDLAGHERFVIGHK